MPPDVCVMLLLNGRVMPWSSALLACRICGRQLEIDGAESADFALAEGWTRNAGPANAQEMVADSIAALFTECANTSEWMCAGCAATLVRR
jgi:hypothetical protein